MAITFCIPYWTNARRDFVRIFINVQNTRLSHAHAHAHAPRPNILTPEEFVTTSRMNGGNARGIRRRKRSLHALKGHRCSALVLISRSTWSDERLRQKVWIFNPFRCFDRFNSFQLTTLDLKWRTFVIVCFAKTRVFALYITFNLSIV